MRVVVSVVFALGVALGAACAAAAPSPAPSIPLDQERFFRDGARDANIEVRWHLAASETPGAEDDPGPHLRSGVIGIAFGPPTAATRSLFAFSSLGMLPPHQIQMMPTDASDGCGASGPDEIIPLPGSRAPVVLLVTVAIGKGCLPVVHTFVPHTATSGAYDYIATFTMPDRGAPQTVATPPPHTRAFRIERVSVVRRASAKLAVVSGRYADGRRARIALDLAGHGVPAVGSSFALEPSPNGLEGRAIPLR